MPAIEFVAAGDDVAFMLVDPAQLLMQAFLAFGEPGFAPVEVGLEAADLLFELV